MGRLAEDRLRSVAEDWRHSRQRLVQGATRRVVARYDCRGGTSKRHEALWKAKCRDRTHRRIWKRSIRLWTVRTALSAHRPRRRGHFTLADRRRTLRRCSYFLEEFLRFTFVPTPEPVIRTPHGSGLCA